VLTAACAQREVAALREQQQAAALVPQQQPAALVEKQLALIQQQGSEMPADYFNAATTASGHA